LLLVDPLASGQIGEFPGSYLHKVPLEKFLLQGGRQGIDLIVRSFISNEGFQGIQSVIEPQGFTPFFQHGVDLHASLPDPTHEFFHFLVLEFVLHLAVLDSMSIILSDIIQEVDQGPDFPFQPLILSIPEKRAKEKEEKEEDFRTLRFHK
jgi:hypothetical protein